MNRGKIVLYNPLPREKKHIQDNFIITPMSLLAVASLLDKEGYRVVIADATVDGNYNEIILKETRDALYFGITMITGHQIEHGVEAVKLLRKNNINTPVVVGGYHPSILAEETINSEYIDFVVCGQGQRAAFELAEAMNKRKYFSDIVGLLYKEDGRIICNSPRLFEDINNFPSTPYHLINLDKYIYDCSASGFGTRTVAMYTSQGCPWKCGFCAENKVTKNKWSGFNPQRVADEIELLVNKHNANSILIYDTNFVIDKHRIKGIFSELGKRGIVVPFGFINARADWLCSVDEELWGLIKPYIKDVLIGAEAGDDNVLEFINKGITIKDLLEAKKVLRKHDITVGYSFMVGLPLDENMGITVDDEFKSIIRVVKQINAIDNNNNIRMFNYTPYPGTPLFEYAKSRGLKVPDSLEGWSDWDNEAAQASWIPRKYEKILDQMNRYILPYTSRQYDDFWEQRYKGRSKLLKRLFHNILKTLAAFRLNTLFFSLPLEYHLLLWARKRKARVLICR